MIYGPFNPIYGIGASLFYVFLIRIKKPINVFWVGTLLGGIFEYLCSYFQELIFGTTSWNYSNQPFNINGRTSLYLMIVWGILGLIFVYILYPPIDKFTDNIPTKTYNILTFFLLIFILWDCFISTIACIRQKERAIDNTPNNKIETYLDKHYPDERLNKIYVHAKRSK